MTNINSTGLIWLTDDQEENTIAARAVVILDENGSIQEPGSASIVTSPDNPLYVTLPFKEFPIETLTAPGTSSSLNVSGYSKITCQYKVSSINSSVSVSLESSSDDTLGWFNLDPYDYITNITENGIYAFILTEVALKSIRFNFHSEVGGTTAVIDIKVVVS